jgi:hypothetical protein
LNAEAMQHIKNSGVVVYTDVYTADILKRLQEMKVDRIVGAYLISRGSHKLLTKTE